MTLCDLFVLSFKGRRDTVAIWFRDQTYTFGELDSRSNRLARLLSKKGMSTGDRLCVYLVNGVGMIDIYLACVKLGVIFVPINILYRDREISHILSDAEPRALIAVDAKNDATVTTEVPIWTPADLCREAAGMEDGRPLVYLDGDSPAGIIYTQGTNGP